MKKGLIVDERDGYGVGVLMNLLPPLCSSGHLAPDVGGFWHLVEPESTVLVQTSSPQTLRTRSITHLPWSYVFFCALSGAQYILIQ